jgi:hypothetical protein
LAKQEFAQEKGGDADDFTSQNSLKANRLLTLGWRRAEWMMATRQRRGWNNWKLSDLLTIGKLSVLALVRILPRSVLLDSPWSLQGPSFPVGSRQHKTQTAILVGHFWAAANRPKMETKIAIRRLEAKSTAIFAFKRIWRKCAFRRKSRMKISQTGQPKIESPRETSSAASLGTHDS